MIANIVQWVKNHTRVAWMAFCVVLVGWGAYNLGSIYAPSGRLATASRATPKASASKAPSPGHGKVLVDKSDPRVVTSKGSSSKKYHYSWCSSGKRIKPENQVWFPSEAAAQTAGYTLAGNCKP